MFETYLPMFVMFAIAAVICAAMFLLGQLLGPKNPTAEKLTSFECGNDTLTSWHPMLPDFTGYRKPTDAQLVWSSATGVKVRFAWQLPVAAASEQWPSSIEDSLILTNIDWFKALEDETDKSGKKIVHRGALAKVIGIVLDHPDHVELLKTLHDMLRGSFSKGDFCASIFERMEKGQRLVCPAYILGALAWLNEQLTAKREETL